jgi:hypothetical protein
MPGLITQDRGAEKPARDNEDKDRKLTLPGAVGVSSRWLPLTLQCLYQLELIVHTVL